MKIKYFDERMVEEKCEKGMTRAEYNSRIGDLRMMENGGHISNIRGSEEPNDKVSEIKAWREGLGLSRMELAQKLGVSYFSIVKWELGSNNPSPMAQRQIKQFIALQEGKGEGK